jgi:hypothetical protein
MVCHLYGFRRVNGEDGAAFFWQLPLSRQRTGVHSQLPFADLKLTQVNAR